MKSDLDVLRNTFEGDKFKADLTDALPDHIPPKRMIKVALGALRQNPALLRCSKASVVSSVLAAAELGLETDGVLGHAYLVPYGSECRMLPGYRGLIELVRRSGSISTIKGGIVRVGDEFDYMDVPPDLRHRSSEEPERDRPITHVYAWCRMRDGSEDFVCWSKAKVDAHRKQFSKASKSPWDTSYEWMAKKTLLRQLVKTLPVSVELQRLNNLEDLVESEIVPSTEPMQRGRQLREVALPTRPVDPPVLEPQQQIETDEVPAEKPKPKRKRRTKLEIQLDNWSEHCKVGFDQCNGPDEIDGKWLELSADLADIPADQLQAYTDRLQQECNRKAAAFLDENEVPADITPDGEMQQ